MDTMTGYLGLDGLPYGLTREPPFRSSIQLIEVDQLTAKRPESPLLDAEITSFEGGIKPDRVNDAGTWVRAMLGLEPTSPTGTAPWTQLRLGGNLDASLNAAGAGPILSLYSWRGTLFAGEGGSDSIYAWNGSAWSLNVDMGSDTSGTWTFAEMKGRLYAVAANSGVVFDTPDGVTWASAFTLGTTGIFGLFPLQITGNTINLYAILDNAIAGRPAAAIIYGFDGNTLLGGGTPELAYLEERHFGAGVVDGGTLYIAGIETAGQGRGTIYTWNGTALTPVARLSSNYPTGAALYKGETWWACGARGELYKLSGGSLSLERTFATTKPIIGLTEFAGALWVAIYNDAATRIELHRWDGTAWSLPHYVTASNTSAYGIAAYGDALYVGAGDASHRRVYVVSATNRVTTAILELPEVVYGAPTLAKRWRRILLEHDALQAGQAVTAGYALDGAAYSDVLTNRHVGATRTVAQLPAAALGRRLGSRWTITNLASLDLTLSDGATRALPAPGGRRIWVATLDLSPPAGGAWDDGTADATDPLDKLAALEALRLADAPFQAVGPFRDADGIPTQAMLVAFDDQTALEADVLDPRDAGLSVRLMQVGDPANMLDNSSFEQDAGGTSPITSWPTTGTGTAAAVDATPPVDDGTKDAKLTFDGTHATFGIQQVVNGLIPGRWHTASVYLWRTTTAGTVRMDIQDGGVTRAFTAILAPATDAAWIRYAVSFLLPSASSGTVTFRILGQGTPGGVLFADAAMLHEGVPAAAFAERGA